ncbi:MAG: DNA primase [Candidatus Aenigmarchaeota archaeon]|nr:DNA primase [Candidatus Aenigmarchaeota archaeon]
MAKLPQSTTKYIIEAQIDAEGIVEKPDIIGAVFGQTEGLLGTDLELRELQRTGRIGRIEVYITAAHGKCSGKITIPSSLDASETALIAAAIETIERVGPCNAVIHITKVEDVRIAKRKYIIDTAKKILRELVYQSLPESEVLSEQIKQEIRVAEITTFRNLPAGPDAAKADDIILVEGRADVLNLLRNGIKNAVAVGGTSIPPEIRDIVREKEVTAFLDGDRGGDLILSQLLQLTDVDYVARAPEGKEVEELTKKEVYKAIREKISMDQLRSENKDTFGKYGRSRVEHVERAPTVVEREESAGTEQPTEETPQEYTPRPVATERYDSDEPRRTIKIPKKYADIFKESLGELVGTRAACIYDDSLNLLGRVPAKDIAGSLSGIHAHAIVLDGTVTKDLVEIAESNGVKFLVGTERDKLPRTSVIVITKGALQGKKAE